MRNFFNLFICTFYLIPTSVQALPYQGSEIVFSAADHQAVQSGQKIAELGGNVVDVAVAIVFSMSVTCPTFAALGGGGFALVRIGKMTEAIDFRERAPQAAGPDYFSKKKAGASITGGAAVGVPGIPAGLYELHKKYGKLPWSRLLDDAILLANKGFRVSGELHDDTKSNMTRFNGPARKIFLKNSIDPYLPGQVLKQKELGRLLSEMRNRNIISFYKGAAAKDIVESVAKQGGDITLKDLADYQVVWRKPLISEVAGHKLYLMPPPSSGGLVMQAAFKLLEKTKISAAPLRSTEELHWLTEVLKRAFARRTLIADPDHFSVPVDLITSDASINELAKNMNGEKASMPDIKLTSTDKESAQTTHLSVLDKYGNAVAMTITLNGSFGSAVATEKYGIMLNNEMDDFTTRPNEPNMFQLIQGEGNQVAPGKRPLSSMSPTLVEKDGKVVMALGAPGGPRIISSVFQTLYRVLIRNMSLESAIEAPRVHHQFHPNKVFVDDDRMAHELLVGLKLKGHFVEPSWLGRVFAVRNVNGILEGVVDTRAEGAARGF